MEKRQEITATEYNCQNNILAVLRSGHEPEIRGVMYDKYIEWIKHDTTISVGGADIDARLLLEAIKEGERKGSKYKYEEWALRKLNENGYGW